MRKIQDEKLFIDKVINNIRYYTGSTSINTVGKLPIKGGEIGIVHSKNKRK